MSDQEISPLKSAAISLKALANLAKGLLSEIKRLQTEAGVDAPTIAAYEHRALSQIESTQAPIAQLEEADNPPTFAGAPTLEQVQITNPGVRTLPIAAHEESSTFEQQIAESTE